jgi:hypothetical protein
LLKHGIIFDGKFSTEDRKKVLKNQWITFYFRGLLIIHQVEVIERTFLDPEPAVAVGQGRRFFSPIERSVGEWILRSLSKTIGDSLSSSSHQRPER